MSRYAFKALQSITSKTKIREIGDLPPSILYSYKSRTDPHFKTFFETAVDSILTGNQKEFYRLNEDFLKNSFHITQHTRSTAKIQEQIAVDQTPALSLYEEWRRRALSTVSKKAQEQEEQSPTLPSSDELAQLLCDTVYKESPMARDKLLAELERDVLSQMNPLAKQQLFSFITNMQKMSADEITLDAEQKAFVSEIVKGFKAAPDSSELLDKDVMRTLERYDTKENFILNSYVNKKPENAVVLGDVLLQASQLKTGFANSAENDLNAMLDVFNDTSMEPEERHKQQLKVCRLLQWQYLQQRNEALGAPIQPVPEDLHFDERVHAPLSKRINNAYEKYIVQKKPLSTQQEQLDITNLSFDFNKRREMIESNFDLVATLFKSSLKSGEFGETFFNEYAPQVEKLNQLLKLLAQQKRLEKANSMTNETQKLAYEKGCAAADMQIRLMNEFVPASESVEEYLKFEDESLTAKKLNLNYLGSLVPEVRALVNLLTSVYELYNNQVVREWAEQLKSFNAQDPQEFMSPENDKKRFIESLPSVQFADDPGLFEAFPERGKGQPMSQFLNQVDVLAEEQVEKVSKIVSEKAEQTYAARKQSLEAEVDLRKFTLKVFNARYELLNKFFTEYVQRRLHTEQVKRSLRHLERLQHETKDFERNKAISQLRTELVTLANGVFLENFRNMKNLITSKPLPTEDDLNKMKEDDAKESLMFEIQRFLKAKLTKNGVSGLSDLDSIGINMKALKYLGKDMLPKEPRRYWYKPEFDDPNNINFVPKHSISFISHVSALHPGYKHPEDAKVVLTCSVKEMKLSSDAEKRLLAICGSKIKKGKLHLKCRIYEDKKRNAAYARQLLLALRREARKADESDEYKIPDSQTKKKNTALDKLMKRLENSENEEIAASQALEIWKKYRVGGKMVVGANLTYGEGESELKDAGVKKKLSKAKQLGYGVSGLEEDEEFTLPTEEEAGDDGLLKEEMLDVDE